MTKLGAAAFAALLVSGAMGTAHAMPVAPAAAVSTSEAAKAAFSFGDQFLPGRPARIDRIDALAAQAAAESYFDFDALITFGALALAGGAFAGFAVMSARRRARDNAEPAWRETVFRAVQAELASFAETERRAA